MLRLFAAIVLSITVPGFARAAPLDTKAKEILLIEESTGTVLFERQADAPIPPASLAKLLTAEYVFRELKEGRIRPDIRYKVSEYAWRTGGALSRTSTMFAALNSDISVMDLLRGVIVHSANDACIILGEGLAGSDAAFAEKLTARAKELGLSSTALANSNGLPDPGNKTSIRDLARLAMHIRAAYPEYAGLFGEEDFEWNKIRQRNRILKLGIGLDGMALGFAEGVGYGIVATTERNGTRLYLAMSGLGSDKERVAETRRVLDWGFSNFARRTVFRQDETVAEAPVFGGDAARVPLRADKNVDIFVPVDTEDKIRARIRYTWPLTAPVSAGQKIGAMELSLGGRKILETPVYASAPVGAGSLASKAWDGLKELMFFWL
ncbi:D-alanyl-D-alanine carboxypeptidase family protein [Rhizobium sp. SG_E_25_P2]|uniref:D-alanyl-D-alanine carboxypeptidase family protein n=1 Tax=Rhizobium sp. SG_E_25_P2 TaxID=2879942 RepID=UPI002476581F|nr:D-alanyl-D-alanine carboxypeptidase family protein [Rhizobium sp. SG_E_25_P2]